MRNDVRQNYPDINGTWVEKQLNGAHLDQSLRKTD